MAASKVGKTNKRLKAEKKANGRPSIYTEELAAHICAEIANGKSARTICLDESMPSLSTLFEWIANKNGFSEQYARAREMQADKYAEETIQIADDGLNDTYKDENGNTRTDHDVVARSRLRVDARKWYVSKLAPKKYGDKLALGGADDLPPIATTIDATLSPSDAYLKMLGKK